MKYFHPPYPKNAIVTLCTFALATLLALPMSVLAQGKPAQDSGQVPALDMSKGGRQIMRVDPKTGKSQIVEFHKPRFIVADCASPRYQGMWLLDSLGDTLEHISTAPGAASWAPDEVRFVCLEPRRRLKILALDAPAKGVIIKTPDGIMPETPSWSPDGKWIAFVAKDSSKFRQVFVVRPDSFGTGFRQITRGRQSAISPCWNAAGDRITFTYLQSGPGLYSVPVEGGMPNTVFRHDSVLLINAVYSPDGKYILGGNVRDGNIYRVNADGSNPLNITKTGNTALRMSMPQVYADGKWVMFCAPKAGSTMPDIYRVPIDGGIILPVSPSNDPLGFVSAKPNR